MSPVWKPKIAPPQLDKYCHLSLDAQRVMLSLYSDYLQQRAQIMDTKRVMSDPRNYYQSIYEARFGSNAQDRPLSACNKLSIDSLNTPNTSTASSATVLQGTEALSSSDCQYTARKLDFRHLEQNKTYNKRLTVSPDPSNYSDSPPVETQDFRILSQFHREDLPSTLGSPSESNPNSVPEPLANEQLVAVSNVDSEIGVANFQQLSEGSKHCNATASHGDSEDYCLENFQDATRNSNENDAEKEPPGTPNLFSQAEICTENRTVHKSVDRKRVKKHCVNLQKSYELGIKQTFAEKRLSSLIKDRRNIPVETEMNVDFSKKIFVSPNMELAAKARSRGVSDSKQTSTYSETNTFNFNPVLSNNSTIVKDQRIQSEAKSSKSTAFSANQTLQRYPHGQNKKVFDKHVRQDMNVREDESENPLAMVQGDFYAAATLGHGKESKDVDAEMAEDPTMEQPQKVYPIFNKPGSCHKQNTLSSQSGGSNQAKRRPASSQRFDAPFKKHKKMESTASDKQTSCAASGVIHLRDLPPPQLSAALADCLDTDEVAIALIFQDGSTQIRPNLFRQEAKKRQTGKQKAAASSVCEVAIGTKSSAYRSAYIFPTYVKDREKFGTFRKFWKKLIKSPVRKIGFNIKTLLIELMSAFGLDLRIGESGEHCVLDVAVGVWLLDPDKPVTTFEQAVNRLALPEQVPCDSSIKALPSDMMLLSKATEKLHKELGSQQLLDVFLCVETPLTCLLAAMEQRHIHMATHTLLKFSEILKRKLQKLEQQAHKAAGHPFLLNSHAQLRQVLFETLRLDTKLPQKTRLAKTAVGRETSTSEAVLTQLSPHHPLPGIVLEYRQLQKLKSTYIDGILSCVSDGKLQTHWDQTAAATGRLTSYQPNVQAIPKTPVTITNFRDNFIAGKEDRDSIDIYARDCFISRPGYSLLAADFQQIELRLLGHLTKDPVLIEIFSDPDIPDIFNALTAQWLGKPQEEVSPSDREQTKRVVYSVMYGVGKDKLAEYLKISPEGAKGIMTSFLVKFPAVNHFTKACVEFCLRHGYTETIFKRRRLFPNIKHSSPALRAQAERQCVNFCIQGSAADICKAAMLQMEQALIQRKEVDAKLLIQIHDELLYEVADGNLQLVTALVKEVMESRDKLCGSLLSLSVPIPVSVSVGKTWGHMETAMDRRETNPQ